MKNNHCSYMSQVQVDEIVHALRELCKDESDGHGSYVADQFMSPEVLAGRAILDKLGVEWREQKYRAPHAAGGEL